MEETLDRLFLGFSSRKLEQLTGRIRECASSLSVEEIWRRPAPDRNAIGNLLLHLAGNVRQWIVSSLGGRPDIRVRDREFSASGGTSAQELLEALEATVAEAVLVIGSLTPEQLARRVTIQGYDVSALEAIYHVVEHYSQHTGQIITMTAWLRGSTPRFYSHLEAGASHGQRTP